MQRAIIDGKSTTGITTMYMAEGLDTGDMLLKDEIEILENDNFEDIHDKLGECGARLIVRTLDGLATGSIERQKQDDASATYAAKITKPDCLINFERSAKVVHDQIRGLSPIPLAFTHTPDGKLLKVTRSVLCRNEKNGIPGEVLSTDDGITVACGEGAVTLLTVVPEGKSRMSAADFVRGRKISVGDILK